MIQDDNNDVVSLIFRPRMSEHLPASPDISSCHLAAGDLFFV